ncbi:MAG TPA: alkaline phosphatase [Flavisolibacter sp.]|jgi:alkaline phosphatase|nr:alkaline phosphatase [Flavisolibacter sp.]
MYRFFLFLLLLPGLQSRSQTTLYSTANAHAHNDYENPFPFWEAWKNQLGSIEADVFLDNGELVVAHDSTQLARQWTLDSLYLRPLLQCVLANGGTVYPDSTRTLQLMIDIKSDSLTTLQALVNLVKNYPSLVSAPTLKFVISGNRPAAAAFSSYPAWVRFDGDLRKTYTPEQLERVEMLSGNFKHVSTWNGKGKMVDKEWAAFTRLVEQAHKQNKKIRFWNAPDHLNAWYAYIEAGVDFINTDHVAAIHSFFESLPYRQYTHPKPHKAYQAKYRNDGSNKPPKNIILLIGDGTGLAQWHAGYTANKAALNVFNMRHGGLSKTSSSDHFITDSAPGATAFSSGQKTNNRAVGVDATGKKLRLLPQVVAARKMKTGIITTGDVRDATPAAFYAHQSERSRFDAIVNDLLQSSIHLLAGAFPIESTDSAKLKSSRFALLSSVDSISPVLQKPLLVADPKAALPAAEGRGSWAVNAFLKATALLSKNKEGFFLVVEGAQIDHGGHANRLPYLVSELLDFDRVIGEAMAFADANGETLVIVTGDHETGGLTLTGGDFKKGRIVGEFSTNDHTGVPVPVFSYGPRSQWFDGVYENTAIFHKMVEAIKR